MTVHIHTEKHFYKNRKNIRYHTQKYVICILLAHITSYHDCPYHILVHLQVGDVDTGTEQRLADCIDNAQCEKERTEQACDLVRYKVTCLRRLLVPDVQMSDKELQDLVTEIEEYEQNMVKAEAQMRSTTSAFMSAHAATMEVLGVAGKVKYHERFRKKGVRDVGCMFCTMAFDNMEV